MISLLGQVASQPAAIKCRCKGVMMRIPVSNALLMASICLVPVAASAASGSYISAVSEVFECLAVTGSKRTS